MFRTLCDGAIRRGTHCLEFTYGYDPIPLGLLTSLARYRIGNECGEAFPPFASPRLRGVLSHEDPILLPPVDSAIKSPKGEQIFVF